MTPPTYTAEAFVRSCRGMHFASVELSPGEMAFCGPDTSDRARVEADLEILRKLATVYAAEIGARIEWIDADPLPSWKWEGNCEVIATREDSFCCRVLALGDNWDGSKITMFEATGYPQWSREAANERTLAPLKAAAEMVAAAGGAVIVWEPATNG